MAMALRCRCGHSVEAHEIFRGRRGCAACRTGGCRRFDGRRARAATSTVVLPGVAWNRFRGRTR